VRCSCVIVANKSYWYILQWQPLKVFETSTTGMEIFASGSGPACDRVTCARRRKQAGAKAKETGGCERYGQMWRLFPEESENDGAWQGSVTDCAARACPCWGQGS
jgi:hypothetical protein